MPRLTEKELAERRLGMGSTDVVEACGLAPWEDAGPMRLFLEKTGARTADDGMFAELKSDHLEWGHVMEPVILDWYTRTTGYAVIPGGHVPHRSHSWLWASLDGFAQDRNVEIKNVASNMAWHWDAYSEDGIPRYVRAQVAIGMACSGKGLTDVVACIGGRPPHIWTVAYDEELADLLIKTAYSFWGKVIAKLAPPLDATKATKEYLRGRFPGNEDRVILDASPDINELGVARAHAHDGEKRLASTKAEMDARLLEAIGEHSGVQGDGWRMTWKLDKNGVRKQRFTTQGGEES